VLPFKGKVNIYYFLAIERFN